MLDYLPTLHEAYEMSIAALQKNQFFQGGFILGILAIVGRSLQSIPIKIWNRIERVIVYTVNIEETDPLFVYFEMWLSENHKSKYRNIEAGLNMKKTEHSSESQDLDSMKDGVKYRQFDDLFFLRRGTSLLRIDKGREKLENASSLKNAFYNKFTIQGIFCKRTIDKLLQEVVDFNIKRLSNNTVRIYRNTKWGDWTLQDDIEVKNMNLIHFESKELVINDIKSFLTSESWYKKRGIPYKRGYLFEGPPGNGKTSFLLALGNVLEKNIYFLNLKDLDDDHLVSTFGDIETGSIIVIEDIDAAFKSNSKSSEDEDYSARDAAEVHFAFSTLLNCLDGAFSKRDMITIFTTNHIEKLDPALIRTGRIDKRINFGNPNNEYVKKYFECFYDTVIKDFPSSIENKLSMSKVQETCIINRDDLDSALKLIEKLNNKN